MSDIRTRICEAWRKAAADLGFRFTSPYSFTLPSGERECLGLVHGFGGKFGTLVDVHGDKPSGFPSKTLGDEYTLSELTSAYAEYRRDLFVATLDDWGWSGSPAQRPAWYTGKPWT